MPRHHDDQKHPTLTGKQDAEQRGEDPPGSFGHSELPSGDLDPDWTPNDDVKDIAEELDSDFALQFGESVMVEFIRGHTPTDLLREIVQNECDAGGDSVMLLHARRPAGRASCG